MDVLLILFFAKGTVGLDARFIYFARLSVFVFCFLFLLLQRNPCDDRSAATRRKHGMREVDERMREPGR